MKPMTNPIVFMKIILSGISLAAHGFTWLEFEEMAWGTGTWLGELSLNWALILTGFSLFMLFSIAVSLVAIWDAPRLERATRLIISVRERLGAFRWVLVVLVLVAPVWLLQYTAWGVVIHKPFLRLEIWGLSVLLLGVLFTRGRSLIEWSGFVTGLVLSAGVVVMAVPLQGVTDYPFSLGWSEGNRLWDYSVMFGRELYDYPVDEPIPVLLDIGRQFVGGLVFLLPHVSIVGARLWVAMTYILPYLVLGWVAFKAPGRQVGAWLLAGLWAYTFLNQGPIHPPLVVCAILVALAWRRPLWLSIPLVIAAGYLAEVSRWTWMFAPGMWLGMLELAGASTENGRLNKEDWVRALTLGVAGVFGGSVLPNLVNEFLLLFRTATGEVGSWGLVVPVNVRTIVSETSNQPLLWYRLLPNATYGIGIIPGLIIATFPLILLLVYLAIKKIWLLNTWQRILVLSSLLAFLVVGLIVSVKIGGGGDLHNLDMFIIGSFFAGAIAWRSMGSAWVRLKPMQFWLTIIMVAAIGIPAYQPLLNLYPLSYAEQMGWVMTLRDDHSARIIAGTLPTDEDVDHALELLEEETNLARNNGSILFMDQRQLLTFGYIDVPLIPDYDKKVLINNAMSSDQRYFETFYADLAAHRFSLIVTNPLNDKIKDVSYQFGEENNAWVTWVSVPLLCYYEPKITLMEVGVQLLIPKTQEVDCASKMPLASE